MSDRLKELQRHRAMLQEHLAWLDREIAALGEAKPSGLPPAEGVSRPYMPPPPAPVPVAPLPPSSPVLPSLTAQLASAKAAEEIMAQYQTDSMSVQSKTRLGCFLYFFLALGMVGLVVLIFYLRTVHKR
jgi:hypothetical protein